MAAPGKVRVSSLAKDEGVDSKVILRILGEIGEYVKNSSSSIESPVVRRVKEKLAAERAAAAPPEPAPAPPAEPAAPEAAVPAAQTPASATAAPEPQAAQPGVPGQAGADGQSAAPAAATPAAKAAAKPGPATAAEAPAAGQPAAERPQGEQPAKPTQPSKPAGEAPAKPGPAAKPATDAAAQTTPPASGAKPATPTTADGKPAIPRPIPKPGAVPIPKPRPMPPRPGATGGLPTGGGLRRNPAPRRGNNPFASEQGMGQWRQRPEAGERTGRFDGNRPGADSRTGGTGTGAPGQRRPDQRGTGRPGQQRGGFGGTGGPGGGRSTRGGRGGQGTQGAFGRSGPGGKRGRKSKRQRRLDFDEQQERTFGDTGVRKGDGETIRLRRGASLTDLAEKIGAQPAELVKVLFELGEMVNATQSVPDETLEVLGVELNYNIEVVSPEDEDRELLESFDIEFGDDLEDEDQIELRPPVVTVMGHVDHGKTKLLDALRHTHVVEGEAGGITQAIGAYQVTTEVDGEERKITFIDTPGHEAFTAMRARGAKATDIAVLVVAADDGVMPQTIEALNHAQAADVPIVVAVNKIDKEGADPSKVRGQLTEYGLIPEEYGGEAMFVDVSAVTHDGLDALLEAIILTADAALDLRVNPNQPAQGVAIEAHLDRGRGPVATVLVHRGTLHTGDSIVAGSAHGRVRALIDDHEHNVDEAPPSMPVQVLGLTSVPGAGDSFIVVDDDRTARQIAEQRESRQRAAQLARSAKRVTMETLLEQMQKGEATELRLILKGDTAGAVEALEDALLQIEVDDEVALRVIDRGVGAVTETNVDLAQASEAVIIAFNVRAEGKATQMANSAGVDIRYYKIIYEVIDDIEAALKGMLKPIYEEQVRGQAEIREIFRSSKFGNIAGCMVIDGTIRRNAKARLLRDSQVVAESSIASLRREKDDVTEVREGYECGMTLHNYNDIHLGDIIETFEMVEKPRG